MSSNRLSRRWVRGLALAAVLSVAAGGVYATASPVQAAPTPPVVQFTTSITSPDTATSPVALPNGTPITLAVAVTNTSNFKFPMGRVSVQVPSGISVTNPTTNLPGWGASLSGQTINAVVTKPLLTQGVLPGAALTISATVLNTLTVTTPLTLPVPVSATGPFGVVKFTAPTAPQNVIALPKGVAAFAGSPNVPLTGLVAPSPQGSLCVLDPTNPVCSTADLGKGANGNVYFSQTTCTTTDATCTLGTEVELSGNFGTLYSPSAPGSVTLTCIASTCVHRATGGTGAESESFTNYDYNYTCASGCSDSNGPFAEREVNEDFANYPVYVELKGSSNFLKAPRCVPENDLVTKGVITSPDALAAGFCVDVNAITRAGNSFTGNLVRPVLFIEDPRMR